MTGADITPDSVKYARYALVRNGLSQPHSLQTPVANIIERSWRRSVSNGIELNQIQARYVDRIDLDAALIRAASPVLDRLRTDLADTKVALLLCDQSGQIIARHAGGRVALTALDNVSAAEGFNYSEEGVGTNALGTAITEGVPLLIHASEHFSDALEAFTCAAAPIRSPLTRRAIGSFSLACAADSGSPIMLALAIDAGRQIEQNLLNLSTGHEHALMSAFLSANQSSHGPVAVFSDRAVVASTAGLTQLAGDNHAMIWEALCDERLSFDARSVSIPLPGGTMTVLAHQVEGTGKRPAFTIEILTSAGSGSKQFGSPPSSTTPQRAISPFPDVNARLSEAAKVPGTVAISGPGGSGKLHTAHRFLAQREATGEPLVLDASTSWLNDDQSWFRRASDQLRSGGDVIIRHLHQLPDDLASKISALDELAALNSPPTRENAGTPFGCLVVTFDARSCSARVAEAIAQVAIIVDLPPLQLAKPVIPRIVADILRDLAITPAKIGVSAPAMQSLMRWQWPGHIAELRRTLAEISRVRSGGMIEKSDLPKHILGGATGRLLSRMEVAERELIVTALSQAEGNRSRAAGILGIGRTTLYRKLGSLRIEGAEELLP